MKPALTQPQSQSGSGLEVAPGILLVQTYGLSMWPALRDGDLLFGHPLRAHEMLPPGTVLVVDALEGLMAHRLERIRGKPGHLRFFLAGDLSGPDLPFAEAQVRGVAEAVYRKGQGFLDIPAPLPLGPLGRRLVARLALAWQWLERAEVRGGGAVSPRLLE